MQDKNIWSHRQRRVEMKAYQPLGKLDDQDIETMDAWMKEKQVEIFYDLNDETDYAVGFIDFDGKAGVARISDCVTINGIRWNLQPGKNLVPKSVYEFIMQCPEQRRRVSNVKPFNADKPEDHYLGTFRSRR